MPRQTFSEFIALFCVSSPSAPAFPALKRRCWRHGHLWPQTQSLANGPKLCNVSLKFHFFFSLGYSSSSLWLTEYVYCLFWVRGNATCASVDDFVPLHPLLTFLDIFGVWLFWEPALFQVMSPCWNTCTQSADQQQGKGRFVFIQVTKAFQYFPHSSWLPKYYSSLYLFFFSFPKLFVLTITSSLFNMIYFLSNPVNS